MNYSYTNQSFSILLTTEAVEIYPGKFLKENADLVCFCHQYQAAIRIAKQASSIRKLPIIINKSMDLKSGLSF